MVSASASTGAELSTSLSAGLSEGLSAGLYTSSLYVSCSSTFFTRFLPRFPAPFTSSAYTGGSAYGVSTPFTSSAFTGASATAYGASTCAGVSISACAGGSTAAYVGAPATAPPCVYTSCTFSLYICAHRSSASQSHFFILHFAPPVVAYPMLAFKISYKLPPPFTFRTLNVNVVPACEETNSSVKFKTSSLSIPKAAFAPFLDCEDFLVRFLAPPVIESYTISVSGSIPCASLNLREVC